MGTKVLLQQRTSQSFDENISEEIPMVNCFSEGKRSTQVYSKEQLNENPESNIRSNNDVDFKIELTIVTITKRKHKVNNTSKASNDSNNDTSHNKNKDHDSNTHASCKEKYKDTVIRNGKIVWKHGPYCYFRLNLKYLGWPYKEYSKSKHRKMVAFA